MNLTNVFIDILRSAMTQTSCDMIEGLSTQDWEKIYDISQKQQLAPMIYQQIFSNESFQNSDPGFQQFWKGDTIDQAGNGTLYQKGDKIRVDTLDEETNKLYAQWEIEIKPPTGLATETLPFVWMLVLAGMTVVLELTERKKDR